MRECYHPRRPCAGSGRVGPAICLGRCYRCVQSVPVKAEEIGGGEIVRVIKAVDPFGPVDIPCR